MSTAAETDEHDGHDDQPVKPKGGPALLIMFVITLAPGFALGYALGAGPAAVVGAFAALFGLIAFQGGSLRADLRLAAWVLPVMLFAAVVPRLLGEVSRPAAVALLVVIAFGSALLPLRGPRFTTVGLAVGMVSLFSFGIAVAGPVGPWQLVIAGASGLVAALLVRVLMGLKDPGKPTREKVAALLDDELPDRGAAVAAWLDDGRPEWLGQAIGAASRYHLAMRSADSLAGEDPAARAAIAAMRERASAVAEAVRAPKPTEQTEPTEPTEVDPESDPTPEPAPGAVADLLAAAATALDDVELAARNRVTTRLRLDPEQDRRLGSVVGRPTVRLRSIQVRHAVRTAIGTLLILLVVGLLPPGDPLVATALLTTFGILQASWRETLDRAKPRVLALLGGGLTAALVVTVLPQSVVPIVAGLALAFGLWFITARPTLAYSAIVVVSVGFTSTLRADDPLTTLLVYVGLTVSAVVIGVVIGFAVVPALRPRPLPERLATARAATAAALEELYERPLAVAADTHPTHRLAVAARQELVPDHEELDDRQQAGLDRYRTALEELGTLGSAAALGDADVRAGLRRALDALEGEPPSAAPPPGGLGGAAVLGATLLDLVDEVEDARRALLDDPDQPDPVPTDPDQTDPDKTIEENRRQ
jgi:hypothetical protein